MKKDTKESYQAKMLKVLLHIQGHLDEPVSVEELAGVAHFSPFHFHRIFRGMIGEGVMEHVRRLRLERAAQQLTGTRLPVTRIAFEAGYEAHEAFTRAFRAMFGMSPSEFRRRRSHLHSGRRPANVGYVGDGNLKIFTPNDTGGKKMDAQIKHVPARRVVFVRHVGPYQAVEEAWTKLCAWAGPKGLLGPGTVFLGLCYDDPEVTPPDKIRYDACLEITGDIHPEGEIGVGEITAGNYAVAVHKGSYDDFKDFYARLCGEWLPAQGREIRSAPSIEIYLNNPQSVPPEELLTEVYIPVE